MAIFVKNDSRNIFGIDETKVPKVTVSPMREDQIELCEDLDLQMKNCFRNSYNVVMNEPDRFIYVLGAGEMGLAYEHAFIKDTVTNSYFDPTGYLILGHEDESEMYVIKEFNFEELSEFVLKQEGDSYPPDFATMSKLKIDMDMFITASQFFKLQKEYESSPAF
jgi:hypothetical protein